MHFRRVDGHGKLQFAKPNRAALDVSLEHVQCPRFSGISAGKAHKSIRIVGLQGYTTGVIATLRKHPSLSSLQHCRGHLVVSLVGHKLLVRAASRRIAAVAGMLVNVEYRFCLRWSCSQQTGGCQSRNCP